jgi:hypothetical protein
MNNHQLMAVEKDGEATRKPVDGTPVKDAGGKPIDDAEVTVQFFMPAMPMNMPAMRSEAKLAAAGGGLSREWASDDGLHFQSSPGQIVPLLGRFDRQVRPEPGIRRQARSPKTASRRPTDQGRKIRFALSWTDRPGSQPLSSVSGLFRLVSVGGDVPRFVTAYPGCGP